MTIEITNNPHSFIVFLTLSMGISYALFARSGFGLGKLFSILFIVAPLALTAYERHHIVDMGLGFIIGTLFAKGIIDVSRPFDWLNTPLQHLRWKMQQAKPKRAEARAQSETNQTYGDAREQEARRRQEQARREREQARQNQQKQGSRNTKSNTENHTEKPTEPQKSPLELAYDFLGITPTMSYADAKKRYRKMISRYHEDKMPHDLTNWEIEEAKEKSKAVNVAWDLICKNMGW